MSADKKTTRKLTASIIAIILLVIALTITSFALIIVSEEVEENFFSTGDIAINLNDGRPVIDTTDPGEQFRIFEPGMTIKKDFFVENESSDRVY